MVVESSPIDLTSDDESPVSRPSCKHSRTTTSEVISGVTATITLADLRQPAMEPMKEINNNVETETKKDEETTGESTKGTLTKGVEELPYQPHLLP